MSVHSRCKLNNPQCSVYPVRQTEKCKYLAIAMFPIVYYLVCQSFLSSVKILQL